MYADQLTRLEHELAEGVARGRQLTCSQLRPEQLAERDDEQHTLRADVIRAVLIGRLVDDPDPRGVRLVGARITGTLDLDGARCNLGLDLRGCWLDRPITARYARLPQLTLSDSRVPGLDAEGLQVDGSVLLRGIELSGDHQGGGLRLYGARIRGDLDCDGGKLHNKAGPALDGEGLRVGGSVLLRNGFSADGHSAQGCLRLVVARIGVSLVCEHARLDNAAGSALRADGVQVDGSVLLRNDFHASGHGPAAIVRLVSARIGGGLDFQHGRARNPDGPALDLRSASVGWLRLPADLACRTGAANPRLWHADGQLQLDGLTYTDLPPGSASLTEWLHLLRHQTPAYSSQPYQQLASFHRAAGHEADARRVLIAQQDDLRDRGELGGRWSRTLHRLLRLILGYGYQTWRALLALAVVLGIAIGLGVAAGHLHTVGDRTVAAHTARTGRAGTACSTVEQVALGVDRGLPVIDTGIGDRCELDTTTRAGQLLTAIAWTLQVAAWALATLVVAGYTGLIRRT
jgi:hypothetical protein